MYLYESHMGGLYTTDEEMDYDWLYCETCGDSDEYWGEFTTKSELEDLLNLLARERDFTKEYIKEFLLGLKDKF